MVTELQAIAKNFSAIDITQNFEKAEIDFWAGKFGVEVGGVKRKNYLNVVLKSEQNSALADLAEKINFPVATIQDTAIRLNGFKLKGHDGSEAVLN